MFLGDMANTYLARDGVRDVGYYMHSGECSTVL